jgi:hypothetical protein
VLSSITQSVVRCCVCSQCSLSGHLIIILVYGTLTVLRDLLSGYNIPDGKHANRLS